MAQPWHSRNGAEVPSNVNSSFKLTAPPNTDIWRADEERDTFTGPMIYRKVKGSDFQKLEVTVFAPWKTQYDQGGFILHFPNKNGPSKWIKAGIELFNTRAAIGVVGCDRYSDWSLAPMSPERQQKARFVAERKDKTLWIYAAQEGSELQPMREIKWAFLEGRAEDEEMEVGVYVAKPTQDDDDLEGTKGIDVTFSDLKIETTTS